jgi:two-component system cell cycle sensor histidine kinase/response regulator CckA
VSGPRESGDDESATPQERPGGDGRPATLLLVEDERALRGLVATVLQEEGYLILIADDGLDAIGVAEAHHGEIDLLITDVSMPRLSGVELAQRLLAQRPGLEVLFVSGYSDSRLLGQELNEKPVNLLPKPFLPDQLIERVAQLTRRSASQR